MFRTEDYLDLTQFQFPELFDGCEHVWDALRRIPECLKANLKPGNFGTIAGTPFINLVSLAARLTRVNAR